MVIFTHFIQLFINPRNGVVGQSDVHILRLLAHIAKTVFPKVMPVYIPINSRQKGLASLAQYVSEFLFIFAHLMGEK